MAGKSSTDVLTPEQRSYCMSRIRGKHTKPEVKLRTALWSLGYRYRLHYQLPGRPDIVFPGRKVVVFVDGCFWHCCPEHFKLPKTRTEFWNNKIRSNMERDKKTTVSLENDGWKVLRFWEHEINRDLLRCVDAIAEAFQHNA